MGCGQTKVEEPAPPAKPTVRASHILIKHLVSNNPESKRTGKNVTETPYEARQAALALHVEIVAGNITFEKAAKTKSDCSSYSRKGDLGEFAEGEKKAFGKPFDDAAFGLAVGEMSGVIITKSGLHIIKRTG